MSTKENAVNAEIIVEGPAEKPCYYIKYYDLNDNRYHIGYSSYDYGIVIGFLRDYFGAPNNPMVDEKPVIHSHRGAKLIRLIMNKLFGAR